MNRDSLTLPLTADGVSYPRQPTAAKSDTPSVTVKARADAESASAIQRMLEDAAAVVQRDDADLVLTALRTTVSRAFSTGGDRSWRELYAAVAGIVERSTDCDVPAFGRLCAFLEENDDLAERSSTM